VSGGTVHDAILSVVQGKPSNRFSVQVLEKGLSHVSELIEATPDDVIEWFKADLNKFQDGCAPDQPDSCLFCNVFVMYYERYGNIWFIVHMCMSWKKGNVYSIHM